MAALSNMPNFQRFVALWTRAAAAWRYVVAHPKWSVAISVFGVLWGSLFFDWDRLWRIIGTVWGTLTAANIAVGLGVVVWAVFAVALGFGYYEQQVRVLERDRDCDVLSKRLDEARLRLEVTDLTRGDLQSQVLELQQQQNSFPLQIQQLRAELDDVIRQHAHAEMEKLAMMAELNKWGPITIVIRFLEYQDRKLADELSAYIRNFAPWGIEIKHEPGSTIRPKHESSRVEIAPAANTHLAGLLSFALARSGCVAGGRVHNVNGDPDGPYCVITVFPGPRQESRG